MDWIIPFEKRIVYGFYVFLIVLNLAAIYFILTILFNNEPRCISFTETPPIDSARKLVYLLFINMMSNLLFVCVSMIAKLYR